MRMVLIRSISIEHVDDPVGAWRLIILLCTLGDAAQSTRKRPFKNVNDLIQYQAAHNPNVSAIGFFTGSASTSQNTLDAKIFSFKDVKHGVSTTAGLLSKTIRERPGGAIGLLSASSPEFLFTWLGCIWLGHPVLLIAPECSPAGIAQLCRDCSVETLITDERNEKLGQEAAKQDVNGTSANITCIKHPFWKQDTYAVLSSTSYQLDPAETDEASRMAYFHHTSGTSSGIPKPIPQSPHGAIGVLPALDGQRTATFTTTPLYHGGPADTFRAWSSNAMIWLFPSQALPITSGNIVRCLVCAQRFSEKSLCPPITYFGAVPYVLQMMGEDETAITWLKDMDLVSVGGAALPQELGDRLVGQGVNLVSRFGSAECGFLLSSHRDYNQDQEWQYLRLPVSNDLLRFEPRGDGLFELIVLPEWPHMAKRNREDGSYATSDLFEEHQRIPGAWKYHSRSDAQLTLVTGLKFDPASLEGPIIAATPVVSDVLVFGNQKPYPGALLFRSKETEFMADADLIDQCAPIVERCCSQSLSHARISRNMLIAMPYSHQPLDKSSKGTILRTKAEQRYRNSIDDAYTQDSDFPDLVCLDDDLPTVVRKLVARFLPTEGDIEPDTDLFSLGVNSIASIQIRKHLQKLLPVSTDPLPITVVEDCGTINRLAIRISDIRNGKQQTCVSNDREVMQQLVRKYSAFQPSREAVSVNGYPSDQRQTIVLTGATGALGSHALDLLRRDTLVSNVYCLVRGASTHAARERVSKALSQKQLDCLDDGDNIEVLRADLSDPQLGLSRETFDRISRETTIIMHLAWSVNFRMRLRSFEKDIAGVRNLINLALSSHHHASFLFCSSVASAMAYKEGSVPEAIIEDPSSVSELGYSQSKWVAEHICKNASLDSRLRGRVSFVRVGQLSGNSENGVWNMREAWPLMLSTLKLVGCLPDLKDEVLDWLSVDRAAVAMIEAARSRQPERGDIQVLHMLNSKREPTWAAMLNWLRKTKDFCVVSPLQWIEKLEAEATKGLEHPAFSLLDHWRTTFSGDKSESIVFETKLTESRVSSLQDLPAVDEQYFDKLWKWIDSQT